MTCRAIYVASSPEEAKRLTAAQGERLPAVRFVAGVIDSDRCGGFRMTHISGAHLLYENNGDLTADEFNELIAFVEKERQCPKS